MSGSNEGKSSLLKTRRRRGSYLGVTGKYPSLRNTHCLFAESFRERDLFALANFDPSIQRLDDHPHSITYRDGKRLRTYSPDAYLRRVEPKAPGELIEVKMSDQLEKNGAEFELAFAAAAEYAKARGDIFRVLTEKELPRPLIRNLRFLFPYRRRSPCERTENAILEALDSPKPLSVVCRELQARGFEQPSVIARAWRLVALQNVASDLDQILTPSSVLERRKWTVTV